MKKGILVVALLAIGAMQVPAAPAAAAASECSRWTAAAEEDEGGPALTARVCASGSDAALVLQCGNEPYFRYDPGPGAPEIAEGSRVELVFKTETASVRAKLDYQAMDGSLGLDLTRDAPLLKLFRAGHTVSVSDAAGRLPPHEFTLAGASAAIAKVIAGCGQGGGDGGD